MRIKVYNLQTYKSNEEYNHYISPLNNTIFNGNNGHELGYIISDCSNYQHDRYNIIYDNKILINNKYPESRRSMQQSHTDHIFHSDYLNCNNNIGPNEASLINSILTNNKVIVVAGALGSGKTELINYVCKLLKEQKIHKNCHCFSQCHIHKDSQIIIDFNKKSIHESDEKDIINGFYKCISQQLAAHIVKLMKQRESLINAFIDSCDEFEYFIGVVEKFSLNSNNLWDTWDAEKRFRYLINYVLETYRGDEKEGVNALLKIYNFYYKHIPRGDQTCLLFVYDNIDGLSDFAQNVILDEINRMNVCWKSIIALRYKTLNNLSHSSFSFEIHQNAGQLPANVIIKRMEYYISHKNDLYKTLRSNIPSNYLKEFDNRIEVLLNYMLNINSRLYQTVSALSGASVRRGLRIFRRFLCNHTISWNENNPVEDMLIRSLYSYKNDVLGTMNVHDDRITNIFADINTDRISLINIRILSIINQAKEHGLTIRLQDLTTHLELFYGEDTNIIQPNLNNLSETKKQLLFQLNTTFENYNTSSTLWLTETGYMYLNFLSNDLQYLQSCFESVDWVFNSTHEINRTIQYLNRVAGANQHLQLLKDLIGKTNNSILPQYIDYGSFMLRMQFLRISLKTLVCRDIIETVNYKGKFNMSPMEIRNIIGIQQLVTIPIVINISNAVLNIFNKRSVDINAKEELMNWYDMLLSISEWNRILFENNAQSDYMSTIITKYQSAIKNI